MNRKALALALIALSGFLGQSAAADKACSVKQIAGSWLFATSVGRQMLGAPFPPDKDITAIGTMYIAADGTLTGTFDVTVEDFAFVPGVGYAGTVTVNPDCTGTITFATSVGSVRSDSIAVVNRGEILGMSQDPLNLWTYQVRRLPGSAPHHEAEDD
ncbi:MAG: hypothetical protein R3176_09965 [Woeseiaceae bacterium]|nr:hypothetical protein [Woeseiaceae bacterium]